MPVPVPMLESLPARGGIMDRRRDARTVRHGKCFGLIESD